MDIQKIKIKADYKLADIVHDIEKGILRIPQFQREFVWDKPRIMRLLESIYLEYPIGSFFFWDAPRKYYDFYRDIAELGLPKPDKYEKIVFILDGQQRLTSLYVTVKGLTLYGRDYKKICFDLDEKVFVDRTPDNQRFVSISDLLSNERYTEVYEGLTPVRKKAIYECLQRFNNYPFSAIHVRDKELDEVCDIFERINQGGQRLNLFDLISASTWTPNFDLRVAVKEENEKLKNKGFGEIDNEVYLQALSLIAKGSCTRPVQLQLRAEDVSKYWQKTIESISLAIDYLKSNLGVVNSLFIPYRGMIALVAYLFYKVKGRSLNHKQSELLAQWFWQTTFSERYSASILTLMTEDRKLMDKIVTGNASIKYFFELNIDSLIQIRMYRKSAIKNGILCLLAKRNPRHFKNNVPLSLKDGYYSDFNSSEKHHVFPKSQVSRSYPMIMVHSLPNFCFIPAELNKEISNKKPSKYFEEYEKINPDFNDTLKSHLIKYDDSIKQDNYMSFLASRATMILEEITRVTGSKIGRVVADNVNKAIDDTEKKLRDFIDKKLLVKDADYWKKCIPSDIVGVVRQRVNEYLSKDPSKTMNDFGSRQLLDFMDIMDYAKIILFNWDVFGSTFRSKTETEKRFLNLKEFRNAVKHSRGEIVSFIQKEGEAALEWLSIILEEAEKKPTVKSVTPAESDEETINRVKNGFVKQALKLIPAWIEKEFPDGKLTIKRGNAGSHRSIMQGGKLILFYYFANNWVYGELQMTTPDELILLQKKLSKPESILDRKDKYRQVRFHMINEGDLKLVQEIIRRRVAI